MSSFRTDLHNNPTAFTTDIAKTAGLVAGTDYEEGTSFGVGGRLYHTAKLLKDPLETTIKVIDKIGFYTRVSGTQRWAYIGIPEFVWAELSYQNKVRVIHFMYQHEGGVSLEPLFDPKRNVELGVSDAVKFNG